MKYTGIPIDPRQVGLPELLSNVFDYWNTRRGETLAPTWDRFNLDELPPKIVPWCSVVDVVRDPIDFIFRFWGTERRNLLGQEVTGKSIRSVIDHAVMDTVFDQYVAVVEDGVPLFFEITATDTYDTFTLINLKLPISNDGECVSQVHSINYNPEAYNRMRLMFGTLPPFGLIAFEESDPSERRGELTIW